MTCPHPSYRRNKVAHPEQRRCAPPLRRLAILVLASILAWLSACDVGGSSKSYFPLDEGRAWTYRVTKNLDEATEPDIHELSFSMKGVETLESGPAQRRHSDEGGDYYLRSDDQGIYRVGSRDVLEVKPKPDNPPRFVLKTPYVVGTQWQALTVPYILQRRNEVPKEVRYSSKPIMMVYAIAALDQKVETAAGSFDKCIKVVGEAKIRLYVDAQFNWREIPLFTSEWYCPGVGLVKLERLETSPSRFMRGGTQTLELVNYR